MVLFARNPQTIPYMPLLPDHELSNQLKINRIRYPYPHKGGIETLIRSFTSKTGILSLKLCYKVSLR